MLMPMCGQRRTTLSSLQAAKEAGRRFSVLTCYDATTASLMEAAGVEVLLVGDTAGEVILGLSSTRDIPPDFLLTLTAAVRRGAPQSFVMADLPFACRLGGTADAVEWCQRFQVDGGSDAVKIEVKAEDAALVSAAASRGIPVVAHLGLLPQSVNDRAGYRAQGRDAAGARVLLETARRMLESGAAMLLLEAVASEVAREITVRSQVPVIGCVAGPHCDGTVVVLHDMAGLSAGHPPRAVKRYADLSSVLSESFKTYVADIHAGRFPVEDDAIHMKGGEYERLVADGEVV